MNAKWRRMVFMLIVLSATPSLLPAKEGAEGGKKPVLHIGAAANLSPLGPALAKAFLEDYPALVSQEPVFSFASSGALVAQLRAGAPWALFLSADRKRPEALVAEGLAASASRVYAVSRLCLASSLPRGKALSTDWLMDKTCRTIAVAKPALAPFGVAAMEALESVDLDEKVASKIVWGNNIAQVASYLRSGAADAAFLPLSIIRTDPWYETVSWILLDEALHKPIEQAAVIVAGASPAEQELARVFLVFLAEGRGKAILEAAGYMVPAPDSTGNGGSP